MSQGLLPKRRFRRDSKGVSGIIATIFMVLIVLFLYSQAFMFIQNEDRRFQESVREVNQMDVEHISELLTVENVMFSVGGGQVNLSTVVTNVGAVPVQIVTLWVLDETIHEYGYNDTLSIYLKPGEQMSFTESNVLAVTIEDAVQDDEFSSWFVTGRGSLIAIAPPQEIIVSQISLGLGYLALDFDAFRYFYYISTTQLGNYPNGTMSYEVPGNTYVALGAVITNLDPKMRTITIDSHSLFWQSGRSGVSETNWFIVEVDDNGNINQTGFSTKTLLWGETAMLVFASDKDMAEESFSRVKTPMAPKPVMAATFLLLHGTVGDSEFGQNIPFVSLYYF